MQAKQISRQTDMGRASPPLTSGGGSSQPPASGLLSENAFIQLLSQLEHVRAGFDEPNGYDNAAAAVDLIHGMVAHVITFAEKNLTSEGALPAALPGAMAKAGDFFQDCGQLQAVLRQSTWKSVMGWFKKQDYDVAQRQQRVQQMLDYGLAVMKDYFEVCCSCMGDPSAVKSCGEAASVFLNELRHLVTKKAR